LSIVTPEDLVISKLDGARDTRSEIQLGDVRSLLASVRGLDEAYLGRWTARLGLTSLYGELRACARGRSRRTGAELMTDTASDVEKRYRDRLLTCTGETRLRMGASMHASAQALVRASILAHDPQASPGRVRQALFLRFYGSEFDAALRERILALGGGERVRSA
jgi:hypothetical protein